MVWIRPRATERFQEEEQWFNLNHNEFFQLQVSEIDGNSTQSYRILFSGEEDQELIIAEDVTEPAICEDWLYLEKAVLPQLVELKSRKEVRLSSFVQNQCEMLFMNEENAKDRAFSQQGLALSRKSSREEHPTTSPLANGDEMSEPQTRREDPTTEKKEIGSEPEETEIRAKSVQVRRDRTDSCFDAQSLLSNIVLDEEPVATIECSKWMRMVYRKGLLLVCCSRLVFLMPGNTEGDLIRIPFRLITSLTKETSRLVGKKVLKVITNDGEEHYFGGLADRDEAYDLLAELWNVSMEKRLNDIKVEQEAPVSDSMEEPSRTEIDTEKLDTVTDERYGMLHVALLREIEEVASDGDSRSKILRTVHLAQSAELPDPDGTDSSPSSGRRIRAKSDPKVLRRNVNDDLDRPSSLPALPSTTKVKLDTKKKNEQFLALFNLPSTEELVSEVQCALRVKNSSIKGTLYLSHNYACFHSDSVEVRSVSSRKKSVVDIGEAKVLLQTVIPFRFIINIMCEDVEATVVDIFTRQNKFLFTFSSITAYIKLSALWNACALGSHSASQLSRSQGSLPSVVAPLKKEALSIRASLSRIPSAPTQMMISPRGLLSPRSSRHSETSSSSAAKSNNVGTSEFSSFDDDPSLFLGKVADWTDATQWAAIFGEEFLGDEDVGLDLEQEALWALYFSEHGSDVDLLKTAEFYSLIRNGVPNNLRVKIWQLCSGAIYKLLASQMAKQHDTDGEPGVGDSVKVIYSYDDLWRKFEGQSSLATVEIEKDLGRSFNHPYYRTVEQGGDGEAINALRRVLTAFSWLNPEIGYCQSMNIVTACLLLFLSEEQTLWLLDSIVTEALKGYYTKDMLGSMVDQRVFEVILQARLPKVYKHINDKLSIPIAWFTLPWFLCLFIGKLPLKCVLRILDCFFSEGVSVLFQVSLALFKISEERIMSTTPDDDASGLILDHMRSVVATKEGGDSLFKLAFKEYGDVTMSKIKELRNLHKLQVILEIEEDRKKELEWERERKERDRATNVVEPVPSLGARSVSSPDIPSSLESRKENAGIRSSKSGPMVLANNEEKEEEAEEEDHEADSKEEDGSWSGKYDIYSLIDTGENTPDESGAEVESRVTEDSNISSEEEVQHDELISGDGESATSQEVSSLEETREEETTSDSTLEAELPQSPTKRVKRKGERSRSVKEERKKKESPATRKSSTTTTTKRHKEKEQEKGRHSTPRDRSQEKSKGSREKTKEKEKSHNRKGSSNNLSASRPEKQPSTPTLTLTLEPQRSSTTTLTEEEMWDQAFPKMAKRASLRLRMSDVQALKNGRLSSPRKTATYESLPAGGDGGSAENASPPRSVQSSRLSAKSPSRLAAAQRQPLFPSAFVAPPKSATSTKAVSAPQLPTASSAPVLSAEGGATKRSANATSTFVKAQSLKSFLFGKGKEKSKGSAEDSSKKQDTQRKSTC